MAHNKGHKMSPDIIIRKEVQIRIETKVMNKKTVKGILKLRPKCIEEIYAQVCSGTQNLYWLKRNVPACM